MGLFLTEIFHSVQGETTLSGLPTTFIRLSGCNLRCSWCDTPYSFPRGKAHTIEEIVARVEQPFVCVTGGEPLLQPEVHSLLQRLCDKGYVVSLETSGSLPIATVDPRVHVILDIKCPGSGMSHKNHWPNLQQLRSKDQVKFVVQDRADFDWAIPYMEQLQHVCTLLVSPVFGKLEPKELVAWMLACKLPLRLNVQIHKLIWEPTQRGV